MAIHKCYELSCDICKYSEFPPGRSVRQVIANARKDGWVITKDQSAYCGKECHQTERNLRKK